MFCDGDELIFFSMPHNQKGIFFTDPNHKEGIKGIIVDFCGDFTLKDKNDSLEFDLFKSYSLTNYPTCMYKFKPWPQLPLSQGWARKQYIFYIYSYVNGIWKQKICKNLERFKYCLKMIAQKSRKSKNETEKIQRVRYLAKEVLHLQGGRSFGVCSDNQLCGKIFNKYLPRKFWNEPVFQD